MKIEPLLVILALLFSACGSSLDAVAVKAADATCGKVDSVQNGLRLAQAFLDNVAGPNADAVDVLVDYVEAKAVPKVEATCALYAAMDRLRELRESAKTTIVRDRVERAIEQVQELIDELRGDGGSGGPLGSIL